MMLPEIGGKIMTEKREFIKLSEGVTIDITLVQYFWIETKTVLTKKKYFFRKTEVTTHIKKTLVIRLSNGCTFRISNEEEDEVVSAFKILNKRLTK